MSWEKEVEEIRARRARALGMGGPDKIARQHAAGRMTIRERIDTLVDAGSFLEIGALAGTSRGEAIQDFVPDGYVCGLARIDGREVAIGGEDFTVKGGTEGSKKPDAVEKLAQEYRVPLVLLHDGAGFNIASLLDNREVVLPGTGDMQPILDLLGTVPVVSAIMGPVAGGPAGRAMMAHWSVMVKGTSELFVAGPPVVKAGIGLDITKQELGGSHVHTRVSGAVDNEAGDEADCLAQVRRFLSFFPGSVWQAPPYREPADRPDRREEALLSIIPRNRRQAYDMRRLIRLIVDDGDIFEITPHWAGSLITAMARLNGHVVGVLAHNPKVRAGALDANAADKQVHFMELCDQFGIPLVFFVDVPGLMVGPQAEQSGTIRKGMRALWMTHQLRVPLLNVNVRRCYGFGGAVTRRQGKTVGFAWPSAEFGGIPIEGGVDAAFRREIESAPDPQGRRREIQAKLQRLLSPVPAAEVLGVEDLIDPRDTRPMLIRTLQALLPAQDRFRGPLARSGVRP
ncbi:MAG: acyl-CoA carboxylase subunit beta [Gammaproteobacteria bacterium]